MQSRLSTFVDYNWNQLSRATTTVVEQAHEVKVTWYGEQEANRFRAIVRQKPNPIGFRAKLPGDAISGRAALAREGK